MKKLLILCIAITLLLAACGQAPDAPTTALITAIPTEAPITTTEPAPIEWATMFSVTEHKLPPPKENFDAEFTTFYNEFAAAVGKKDMRFIDGILDDEVMSSFGGDPGKEYFHTYWDSQNLWAVLDEIVALGGVYYPKTSKDYPSYEKFFVAPYTFQRDFEGLDGYGFYVVIDKGVPVYKEEDAESEVVTKLDYRILEFHHSDAFWDKGPEDFVSVTTLSGSTGYIQKKFLRSPIDYRLCIEQKDGEWKLLWLIAGD